MQDPASNPSPNHLNSNSIPSHNNASPSPPRPKKSQPLNTLRTNPTTSFMKGGGSHQKRAHSKVNFRLLNDLMNLSLSDAFNGEGGGNRNGGSGSSTDKLDADQSGVEGN
ncbi:transcription factor RF2b-like [Fagus crenata]